MPKIWRERASVKEDELKELPGYAEVVARVLYSRGVKTKDEAELFFKPEYGDLFDPLVLSGMEPACARIQKAIAAGEQITIYADYDADAVTAAAVLLLFFREIGYKKINYYIPDRFSEGYGVNPEAVRRLAEDGTKLIITVDTGTNAHEAVKTANSAGVDVVVTDHHQVNNGLPPAAAVVNQHQAGDKYPFKDLTGVGVAFKLVQALIQRLPETGSSTSSRQVARGWEKWLLDLVAIGTVADCQSLLGENRILVKWGMYVLRKTKWLGLRRLIEVAEIDERTINAYAIGFQIAPRINAAGRIDHAEKALKLLISEDEGEATSLAYELNELNAKRQNLTDQILSEARDQVVGQSGNKIRFAYDDNWPKGILGLVAGRLTNEFNRPVLVMSLANGEVTGSARSIEGFSIIRAMKPAGGLFEKYGGHDQAAGFSLKEENLEDLKKGLLRYAEEHLDEDTLRPEALYDARLEIEDVNEELVDILEMFEPVGVNNPKPLFRLDRLEVRYPSQIGTDGKHLRFYVGEGAYSFSCIGFGLGSWAERIASENRPIDVICAPQYNEWNGERKIQLKITELRFSE